MNKNPFRGIAANTPTLTQKESRHVVGQRDRRTSWRRGFKRLETRLHDPQQPTFIVTVDTEFRDAMPLQPEFRK